MRFSDWCSTVFSSYLVVPVRAVGYVVLHRQAPLPEAGFPEGAAVSGGPTEIHLQHAEPAIGQELGFRVEAPTVARPRPAVRVDHAGQVPGLAPGRQGQIAVYGQSVAALILNWPHRGHIGLGKGGVDFRQLVERIGRGVIQVARTGSLVVLGRDTEFVLVARTALRQDLVVREDRKSTRRNSSH